MISIAKDAGKLIGREVHYTNTKSMNVAKTKLFLVTSWDAIIKHTEETL